MPADTLYTLLACTSVATLGALAVIALPWRAHELTESWLAWRVLATRAWAGLDRLREVRPVAPARAVRAEIRTAA